MHYEYLLNAYIQMHETAIENTGTEIRPSKIFRLGTYLLVHTTFKKGNLHSPTLLCIKINP